LYNWMEERAVDDLNQRLVWLYDLSSRKRILLPLLNLQRRLKESHLDNFLLWKSTTVKWVVNVKPWKRLGDKKFCKTGESLTLKQRI
jgi:hypothetical protein